MICAYCGWRNFTLPELFECPNCHTIFNRYESEEPMADNCPYDYPTLAEAEQAGINLFMIFTGQITFATEKEKIACIAHCAYCLAGYGLSLGLPDPMPMLTASRAECESGLQSALMPLDNKLSGAVAVLDWKTILRLAITLILRFLG